MKLYGVITKWFVDNNIVVVSIYSHSAVESGSQVDRVKLNGESRQARKLDSIWIGSLVLLYNANDRVQHNMRREPTFKLGNCIQFQCYKSNEINHAMHEMLWGSMRSINIYYKIVSYNYRD